MNSTLEFMTSVATNGWMLALFAVALLIYSAASIKKRSLPRLPVKLILLYLVLQFVFVNLPAEIGPNLKRSINVAAVVALYCAITRLLFSILVESAYYWSKKKAIPKITRDLVLMTSYAVVIFIVLRTRGGVNLVGLITTSAVLTAVIGLAAQNFLGNLFAGIAIQIEKPFQIGDWIQYGEYSGRVVSVGWEALRLETFDHETVFIPNLDISKSVIKNYSMPTPRHAMKLSVGVEYGASPNRVREVLLEVCNQEPMVLKNPPPVVRLTNFGDFAVMYEIRFFYMDYGNYPDLKAAMMNRVWYALRRAGIQIPFPVRDVHVKHIERKFESAEMEDLRAKARSKLEKVPILKPLSKEARDAIALNMAVEEYGDGEAIVKQGDEGSSLYILHRGACNVEVSVGSASPTVVNTLASPAFFGEMSLLTGEPRSATVRAKGDALVFVIGKELFKDILVAEPKISEELATALAKRQVETDSFVGKKIEEQEKQASRLLTRIRSFFGIS